MTDSAPSSVENASSPQPEATASETPAYAGTKHKVKIDSQEMEIPYEELVSGYQRRTASEKRFQEAARIKKEVDEFIGSLKSGDLSRLKGLGVPEDKIREFAERELTDYIRYEQLPDSEKAKLAAERERDDYKKRLEEREKKEEQARLAEIDQQVAHELDSEIGQSIRELKAQLGLDPRHPVEPWFIEHITRTMIAHLESQETADGVPVEGIPVKLATEKAWKNVENTVRSYLTTVPADKVLAMLPSKVRDAIRKADVGEAITQMHKGIRDKQTDSVPQKRKDQKQTTDNFFGRLDQRFGI